MGNCQAIDNASLVIQHPCGRMDKLYCPVTATEVMKLNPGHYVALLLTTTTTATTAATTTGVSTSTAAAKKQYENRNIVRITRIKLLRPTDTLVLGQAYRLITTQEVMKGLYAKKHAKTKKKQSEAGDKLEEGVKHKVGSEIETRPRRSEKEKTNQDSKHDRQQRLRPKPSANPAAAAKLKAWQPSLHSISEATS